MTFEWSNFNSEYANPVTAYKGNDLATLNSCSIADFFAGSLDVKPGYLDGLIAFSGVVDTNDSGHTLADYRNVLITGSNLVAKTISTEYTGNPSWKILASSGGLFDSPLFGTKAGAFNVDELSQNVRELGSARDITKLVYAVCVLASIMNSNYMHNNFDAFVSELRTNLEACNGSVDSIYNCCMLALNLVGAPSPDTDEDIVDEDTDEDIIDEDIVDEDIIEEDADEDIIDEDANEGTGTDENEPETPEEEPVVLDDIPSDDIPAWCSERVNIAATNLCGSLQAFLEKCLLNSPYGFPYVNSRGETHLCYFDGNTTSLKQCPINTDYGALANVARGTLSNKLASDNSLTAIRANSFIPDSYFDAPYKIMAPSCEKLDSWAPLWLIPFCFGYTTLDGVSWVSTSDIHKLLSGVKFIARAQLKVAALYCLKQNNIALSSIENDIDGEKVRVFLSACVDCWSRMLIIERFDFPKLLSIYYSCNDGGIPGYVSAIAKGLDEFKQQSKIARQLANVTPGGNVTRGIYIARYSYDVNEYMNEVAFGYKAVADLKRVHKNPSMKNVLLGVTMGGEPVSRDLSSNSTFCINVFGASRAGKGVMTLSVLGTAVADGYPFIYYDNKPEMAETLWKLESELGGERILAVDNESINKFLSDSRNPAMPDRLASAIDFGHLTFERSFKPLFSSAAWDSVTEVTITNSDSSDAGQAESKIAVSAEGQIRGYALFLKYVLLSLLISEKNTDKNRCIPVGKKMISVVDELNATYIKFGIEGLSLSNQGRMGGQLALKNGLKGIVQDLKGDRRDFQAKINELRKQIDKAQADINAGKSKDPNALQNKISSARQELQALESQLYAATPAYNRLKRVGDFFGIAMNGTEKDGTYANTLTFTDTCIAASNFFNQKGVQCPLVVVVKRVNPNRHTLCTRCLVPHSIEILEGSLTHSSYLVVLTKGVGREIASHFREEIGFHGDGQSCQERMLDHSTAGEGKQRVGMQVKWYNPGHVIGNEFRFFHDAIDSHHRIVEHLGGVIDGCPLDIVLTAIEEKAEEQREDHRDDEHDDDAEAQREVLTKIAE